MGFFPQTAQMVMEEQLQKREVLGGSALSFRPPGMAPLDRSLAGIHHIHHLCWVLCANTDKEKGDKATGQFPAPVGTPGTARPAAPHSGQAFPALHPTAPRGRQDSPRARPSATVHLQDPRTAP